VLLLFKVALNVLRRRDVCEEQFGLLQASLVLGRAWLQRLLFRGYGIARATGIAFHDPKTCLHVTELRQPVGGAGRARKTGMDDAETVVGPLLFKKDFRRFQNGVALGFLVAETNRGCDDLRDLALSAWEIAHESVLFGEMVLRRQLELLAARCDRGVILLSEIVQSASMVALAGCDHAESAFTIERLLQHILGIAHAVHRGVDLAETVQGAELGGVIVKLAGDAQRLDSFLFGGLQPIEVQICLGHRAQDSPRRLYV
jgi:hypothetical protein